LGSVVGRITLLGHGSAFVEEILAILHEIDLLKEEFGLLPTVTFLMEEILSGLLQLIVGPFDFLDVDLLFLQK